MKPLRVPPVAAFRRFKAGDWFLTTQQDKAAVIVPLHHGFKVKSQRVQLVLNPGQKTIPLTLVTILGIEDKEAHAKLMDPTERRGRKPKVHRDVTLSIFDAIRGEA